MIATEPSYLLYIIRRLFAIDNGLYEKTNVTDKKTA